jgi:hypothetical protein
LGRSVSVELGLNVNRSTREKTLVWRGGGAEDDGASIVFDVELEKADVEEEGSSCAMTI